MSILAFMVALGILVLVHEWGHYIVAKLSGVWVEKFSIGFGPKIIGFSKNGTDYRIAPIPLGGYVKLYGQDPLEDAEGDEEKAKEIAKDPRSFISKPISAKLATVIAGPAMNLILCFLIMPLVFMFGRMQPKVLDEKPVVIDVVKGSPADKAGIVSGDEILKFNGEEVKTWQEVILKVSLHPNAEVELELKHDGKLQKRKLTLSQDKAKKQLVGYAGLEPLNFFADDPVIHDISANSAAEKAGFKAGDRVVEMNGEVVKYWSQMTKLVQQSKGEELSIKVKRGDDVVDLKAAPVYHEDAKKYLLGVTKKLDMSLFAKKQYGFVEAVKLGAKENFKLIGLTVDVLKRLFTRDLSVKSLGGPIQIAKATSAAAESGVGEFLYLLAFLSIQLGILNLLPIPVLDGGHVVFMAIEGIRRKPLSPKIRQISTQVGMFMLLFLMVVVTVNDINSVWGFKNIFQSIKGIF